MNICFESNGSVGLNYPASIIVQISAKNAKKDAEKDTHKLDVYGQICRCPNLSLRDAPAFPKAFTWFNIVARCSIFLRCTNSRPLSTKAVPMCL